MAGFGPADGSSNLPRATNKVTCFEGLAIKGLKAIEEAAQHVLQENCDSAVRFRLLRDVLKISSSDDEFISARRKMLQSPHVLVLKNAQKEDGGWGRFHSATKSKGRIGTTEAAVERGLALGFEASDPIFRAAIDYLSRLLRGKIGFPDPPERNNRWATGTQLFAASTLSKVDPTLPVLDETWELWAAIAKRTFSLGKYDAEAEILAHQELTGASVKDSYLVLSGRYQLALLGSRANELPRTLENALVDWVWHRDKGIGYLGISLADPFACFNAGMLDRFLTSLEIMCLFPSWRTHAVNIIEWLWAQRNDQGLWDLRPRASMSVYFPLSETWRKARHRQHDWSTRILKLLKSYYASNHST